MSLFPTTRMSILNPVSDFERLFDTLLHNRPTTVAINSNILTSPKANVLESDIGYTIELAIPGFARSDFSIEVNNVLTVSADLNLDSEDPEITVKYREYDYSSFVRSWSLPDSVSVNMIDASYSAGILTITVPAENKTAKKLQIEVR
jgi:HSP20 family protein